MTNQLLLVDADDTLWENNVYFERAIARFMELLIGAGPSAAAPRAPLGLGGDTDRQRAAIRECINREERRVIAECGYGLESFRIALTRAFQTWAPERWNEQAEAAVGALAASIAAEPVEFVAGAPGGSSVEDTLRYLSPRHRLVLMTKGDYAEQTRKLELSGLGPLFEQVHVVAEKNEAAYREKLRVLGAAPEQSWMIGNSPKSDINPALAAGMNAVFIPHPWTWVLEQDAIAPRPGRRLLQLERFTDLQSHF